MGTKDPFDQRLEMLNVGMHHGSAASKSTEIEATVATYERLKSAAAICASLLPKATPSDIVRLAIEIGDESRHRQRSDDFA